jgi:hypothetical protein
MRHPRFCVAPAISYWCDACFVNTSVVLDRAVSGTFTGSLAQVLSRLLEDHNYFIKWQATAIEMIVKGLQRWPGLSIHRALRTRDCRFSVALADRGSRSNSGSGCGARPSVTTR